MEIDREIYTYYALMAVGSAVLVSPVLQSDVSIIHKCVAYIVVFIWAIATFVHLERASGIGFKLWFVASLIFGVSSPWVIATIQGWSNLVGIIITSCLLVGMSLIVFIYRRPKNA